MFVRRMLPHELHLCAALVRSEWGQAAVERYMLQADSYFEGGLYAPKFVVADIGDGPSSPGPFAGFAAYAPSMRMNGAYDLIWIVVHPHYQKHKVGTLLTEYRIDEIRKAGGQTIELVTQKPDYFARFGFAKVAPPLGNGWFLMLKLLRNAEI